MHFHKDFELIKVVLLLKYKLRKTRKYGWVKANVIHRQNQGEVRNNCQLQGH